MSFGERFLSAGIPAEDAGAGSEALVLRFAGTRFRLGGLSAGQRARLAERFGALVVSEAGAVDIDARLVAVPSSAFRSFDTRGWVYEMDFDFGPERIAFVGLGFVGSVDRRAGVGRLLTAAGDSRDLLGVVENYFRVLVAYRVLAAGGALLHSAGVVHGDHVDLFFGPSGAGKTTFSRLSEAAGRIVLSDELNAVYLDADGVWVEQLPFAGDLGMGPPRPGRYALGHAYRLVHGPRPAILAMPPAAGLATLLAAAPVVNGDRHEVDHLAQNLGALAEARPVRRFVFALGDDVWAFLDREERT